MTHRPVSDFTFGHPCLLLLRGVTGLYVKLLGGVHDIITGCMMLHAARRLLRLRHLAHFSQGLGLVVQTGKHLGGVAWG